MEAEPMIMPIVDRTDRVRFRQSASAASAAYASSRVTTPATVMMTAPP
jgi:hypothetical protein